MKNLFKITLAIITTVILISCGNLVESTSSGVTGGGANGGGNTYSNENYSNYQSEKLVGRWFYYRHSRQPYVYVYEFTQDGILNILGGTELTMELEFLEKKTYTTGYNNYLNINFLTEITATNEVSKLYFDISEPYLYLMDTGYHPKLRLTRYPDENIIR